MNNETYDYDSRKYINPTVSRDEQLGFVDRLRQFQQDDMAKISRDTHALGTDVPSNLGGLTGAESTWNRQYVAPQTNAMVANLKATAQASALNTALSNLQNQWKKKYEDAYKAYQRASASGGGGGGSTGGNNGSIEGDVEDAQYTDVSRITLTAEGYKKVGSAYDKLLAANPNADKKQLARQAYINAFGGAHVGSNGAENWTPDDYYNVATRGTLTSDKTLFRNAFDNIARVTLGMNGIKY